MANSGSDDRLYAYEALGFLLGTGGCQVAGGGAGLLDREGVRAPARTAPGDHERRGRGDVRAVHRGVRERRQGFSSRLAAEIRPRLGLALVAGLAPAAPRVSRAPTPRATRRVRPVCCVSAWWRTSSAWSRVSGVSRSRTPRPSWTASRASGSAATSRCFVLCNQLCAAFKGQLAPFAETVTETLLAQTARALAPFASPDGHTHGVLGMFARVADVPDALARAGHRPIAARPMASSARRRPAAAAADDAARRSAFWSRARRASSGRRSSRTCTRSARTGCGARSRRRPRAFGRRLWRR